MLPQLLAVQVAIEDVVHTPYQQLESVFQFERWQVEPPEGLLHLLPCSLPDTVNTACTNSNPKVLICSIPRHFQPKGRNRKASA